MSKNVVGLSEITYVNTNKQEVTDRTIVRVLPAENITAIDVTDMGVSDQLAMVDLYQSYLDWRDTAMKAIPSFESWAEQQANVSVEPKWKAFKQSHILRR